MSWAKISRADCVFELYKMLSGFRLHLGLTEYFGRLTLSVDAEHLISLCDVI